MFKLMGKIILTIVTFKIALSGSMECSYISADFVCPDGYFKCNRSFCLENRFVCDEEDHCEHGKDEYNCGIIHRFRFFLKK